MKNDRHEALRKIGLDGYGYEYDFPSTLSDFIASPVATKIAGRFRFPDNSKKYAELHDATGCVQLLLDNTKIDDQLL